jgi:hypothetical protein
LPLVAAGRVAMSGDFPFCELEGVGGVSVKSRLRVSSDKASGADHKFGKGICAKTLSTDPEVKTRGMEEGIKLLISYTVSFPPVHSTGNMHIPPH